MFAFDHLLHLNAFLFNDENVNLPSKKTYIFSLTKESQINYLIFLQWMFILCVGHSMILLFESTCTNVFNCKMGESTLWFNPFWGVTLYYFPRMCMFECIPLQTFERFSHYFCILYSFHIIKWEIGVYLWKQM
jgi:hypothetical protein